MWCCWRCSSMLAWIGHCGKIRLTALVRVRQSGRLRDMRCLSNRKKKSGPGPNRLEGLNMYEARPTHACLRLALFHSAAVPHMLVLVQRYCSKPVTSIAEYKEVRQVRLLHCSYKAGFRVQKKYKKTPCKEAGYASSHRQSRENAVSPLPLILDCTLTTTTDCCYWANIRDASCSIAVSQSLSKTFRSVSLWGCENKVRVQTTS